MLSNYDNEVSTIIDAEKKRQEEYIELIASENFVSSAVLEAQGSILTNKYAEGYPGARYYCGCDEVDKVETLAIERLKKLFGCKYANVQPHSGSQANQATYLALIKPGDTILSMSLNSGGHLTHGANPNLSGKWFNPVFYNVDPKTNLIDYDEIERLALLHKPKLIICGFSCYSRKIDFRIFREIADKVSAYLMADIAHIAGIIATSQHQNPLPYADVVTSTTHKTLRGPRGGIIMSDKKEIAKLIDKALFPGLQGGPLMHIIAAKAVAFGEALSNEYKNYITSVISNAQILSNSLLDRGYNILTGGTDNHMVILDLRKDDISGKDASESLDRAGITSNKNSIPFESKSPFITSGIRLGTPACTSRGFGNEEFRMTGNMIADILDSLKKGNNIKIEKEIFEKARNMTSHFPLRNQ